MWEIFEKALALSIIVGCCVAAAAEKTRSLNDTIINLTKREKRPFDDFLKKSSIVYHFNKFTARQLAGDTRRSYGKGLMEILDRSDELFEFDLDRLEMPTRRHFEPPGRVIFNPRNRDPYFLRPRIFELMKQCMYTVRDNLAPIMALRMKYKEHALFKMGYLFSRLDEIAKTFAIMAQKYYVMNRTYRDNLGSKFLMRIHPVVHGEMMERMLNLWFEHDLLTDVLRINHDVVRKTLRYMRNLNELDTWFIDSFKDVYHVFKVAAEDMKRRQEERQKEEERQRKRQTAKRG